MKTNFSTNQNVNFIQVSCINQKSANWRNPCTNAKRYAKKSYYRGP